MKNPALRWSGLAVAAAAAALGLPGCLRPTAEDLAAYEKSHAAFLGEVLPLDRPLAPRLAYVDAVSAPGSFLEADQRVLVAALRQRKSFGEVVTLPRNSTPVAAREQAFPFLLRFVEGAYHHLSVRDHAHHLGQYELTCLADGCTRRIGLETREDERYLVVQPGGATIDTGRQRGVTSAVEFRALLEAVERETRSLLAVGRPSAGSKPAPSEAAAAAGGPARRWAVVVGVSKYRNAGKAGLADLAYADADATAFAALLKRQGWPEGSIKLLVNEQATKGNVEVALESWLTKAGPDDLVVLFWSGHGFPDPADPEKVYFACHDTDLSVPATGCRMDKARAAIEELKARNVVVLADTCHAGKLVTRGGKGVGGIAVGGYVEKLRQDAAVPKGWIFMVSAETDRLAVEHSSWSHGAFTHCLLEALGGAADGFESSGARDGVVTMGELRAYLTSAMPEETQKVLGAAKRPLIVSSAGSPEIWNLAITGKRAPQ
jgi:uncharacterized caspase-like protein